MDNQDRKDLASAERRNFLKLTATGGFTAALVAGAAGTLWSTEAAAQSANEERERAVSRCRGPTLAVDYRTRDSGHFGQSVRYGFVDSHGNILTEPESG